MEKLEKPKMIDYSNGKSFDALGYYKDLSDWYEIENKRLTELLIESENVKSEKK